MSPGRGLGERPPTAGLPPRLSDLLAASRESFAQAIARFSGAADAIVLSSGTASLLVVLEHLKRGSLRRTVVIPAYTCPLVVLAAEQAGLRVVACDMQPERFDLDLDHLGRLIGPDTLCVVPTHYGGWLTDVGEVRQFVAARAPEVAIVEDAAQAFGGRWNGVAAALAGDIGIYSFAAGKGLTTFEGGAIVSRSAETLAAIARTSEMVVVAARGQELAHTLALAGYHLVYNPLGMRLVYGARKRYWLTRGSEIDAASDRFEGPIQPARMGAWRQRVGLAALPRLPVHLAAARRRFRELAEDLAGAAGLRVQVPPGPAEPSCTFLMVTLPARIEAGRIQALWQRRIGISKLFTRAIGDYPYLAGKLLHSDTPNARELARRTIIVSTSGIGDEPGDGQRAKEVVQAIRACIN